MASADSCRLSRTSRYGLPDYPAYPAGLPG